LYDSNGLYNRSQQLTLHCPHAREAKRADGVLMNEKVYTPPTEAKYTETANPYYKPPISNRIGKWYQASPSGITTTTLYSVPSGKLARLIWLLPYVIEDNAEMNIIIDNRIFFTIYGNGVSVDYSRTPLINLPYESGIEVLSSVQVQNVTSETNSISAIIIEEDIA